jgi:hypothetical protein
VQIYASAAIGLCRIDFGLITGRKNRATGANIGCNS